MSQNSHFHLLNGATEFPSELISILTKELTNNRLVKDYFIDDKTILVNLASKGFESIFLTTEPENTPFKIPFPDGSMYSGFKYYGGKHNILACKIMLLIKYYLREKVIIASEGLDDYISSDWEEAIGELNTQGFNISITPSESYPKVSIDGLDINNVYDRDGEIFKAIFIPI